MAVGTSDKKNILLIDDDLAVRVVLKTLIARSFGEKVKTYTASSGIEGLGIVYAIKADSIIIDTTLPEYGNRQILDYIKSNKRLNENLTPVIVLGDGPLAFSEAMPNHYLYLDKTDKRFPQNLIELLKGQLTYKTSSSTGNFVNNTGRRIVNYSSKADRLDQNLEKVEKAGLKTHHKITQKLIHYLKWLYYQLVVSVNLTIFDIFGGLGKDWNKQQQKYDIGENTLRVFPTIAMTLAGIFFVLIQSSLVATTVFVSQEAVLTPVQAASLTWNGGGTDGTCGGNVGDGNKWSCGANWSGGVAPASGDTVTFNSTSVKDATIDASFQGTVATININSGYTGTITSARTFIISTAFSQAAGNFSGSNQTITDNGSFSLTGGSFTSTSGTMSVTGNFTISGSPTFNANGGTINFNGVTGAQISCNNATFNLITFTATLGTQKTVQSNCNLPMGNNPSITVQTNIILNGTLSGSGLLTMTGSSSLQLNAGATLSGFTSATLFTFIVQGASIDLSSYSPLSAAGTMSVTSGSLTIPSGTPLNALTVTGGTFNEPSGSISISGALTISGTPTFNTNGGTIDFTGSTATLSCNNVTFGSVNFTGQIGVKTVSSNCNLPLGNNPTIPNGITNNGTLSGTGTITNTTGTLTLNAGSSLSGFTGLTGTSNSLTISGATLNMGSYSPSFIGSNFVLSSGTFTAPTGTLNVASNFTISGGTFNANGGMVLFSSTGAGTISCNNASFNLVTLSGGANLKTISSNCNLPLGNNPTVANNINLSGTLSGTGTIAFSTANTSTLNAGASLSGFSGLTEAGNLTIAGATVNMGNYSPATITGGLTLSSGTLTAPSGSMNIGGSLTISGSPTFNANGGTINATSSSSATWNCNNVTFNSVTLSGVSGTFNVNSNCTLPLGSNPTVNGSGTFSGTYTGSGTIHFHGVDTFDANTNFSAFSGFIADSAITNSGASLNLSAFSPVTFSSSYSQSSGSFTSPSTLSIPSSFTLSGGTFTAPSGTLSIASTMTISGTSTFNNNGGTVNFNGAGSGILSCNNVAFNLVTFTHTSGTKTISSNCSFPLGNNPFLTSTGGNVTVNGTISGTGTLTGGATFTLGTGAVLSGFTGMAGLAGSTITVSGANLDLSSYSSFSALGNLTVSSGSLALPTNANVNINLTISGGTFTAPSGTFNVNGPFTVSGTPTFNTNGGIIDFSGSTATLTCNNITFNSVSFTGQTGVKTISNNCSLPLGNNPTIPNGITNNGTLSGTGTLTLSAGTLTTNSGSALSGFTGYNGTGSSSLTLNGGTLPNFTSFSTGTGTTTIAGATLNLSNATTASTNGLTINSGTFIPPSSTFTMGGFNLNGGSFTAPSGTLNATTAFTIAGGTFNANGGLVNFTGSGSRTITCNGAVFNLVTFTSTNLTTVNSGCTMPLGNNPTVACTGANGLILNGGNLTGTGKLTLCMDATFKAGTTLTGFTDFAENSTLFISGGTMDFTGYSSFTGGTLNESSGSIALPNGSSITALTLSGGTFNAPSGTMSTSGNLNITGNPTFNTNGGTVNFNGTGSQTLNCNNTVFNLVTVTNFGAKTINAGCNLPVGNNATIYGGITLNGTLSGTGTLTQNGNGSGMTVNNGSSFTGFTGLLTTVNGLTLNTGASIATFNGLEVGALTISGANTDLTGFSPVIDHTSFTLTSGSFTAPASMDIARHFTVTGGTFNANGGVINFINENFLTTTMNCNNVVFNKVTFNKTDTLTIDNNCSVPLGNNPTIVAPLVLLSGNLSGSGTLNMSSGTFTMETGSFINGFSGFTADSNSTVDMEGGILDMSTYSSADLNKDLLMNSGTFTAPSTTMTLAGNLTINGGTFNHNNGTVQLDGMNQTVKGTTFYNLTKTTSVADTLTITAGNTETILNNLDLEGASGQLLSLRSSSTGTQWNIDAQGSRVLNYLDVQDSDNINAATMVAEFSADNGNNINWEFNNPPNVPSNLGPTNYVDGSYGTNTQPTLTFTTNDSNPSDTVKFRILIDDNSDFSSPLVDYTSALLAQGSQSFTVGQSAGGGSYTTGSQGQTLPSGTYYWEVMDTDNNNTSSTFVAANGGSVAFGITAQPSVANLGPANVISGNFINLNQPVFNFTLSDPDSGDQVKYEIQIDDNSDFSSPVVDYESGGVAQGSTSFTVGQTSAGGIYVDGGANQTLADGSYYWRVKAIDIHTDLIASSYSNGKEISGNPDIAFKVDTTAPTGSITINNGDTSTSSQNVTLTISASDSGSGVTQMIIAEDPNFVSASYESYSTTKAWVLSSGYGTKNIYIKFKDSVGNVSLIYSASIDYPQPASPTPPPPPSSGGSGSTSGGGGTNNETNSNFEAGGNQQPVSQITNPTQATGVDILVLGTDGQPLTNTNVEVEGDGTYTTDSNGHIFINSLKTGTQTFNVNVNGNKVQKSLQIVSDINKYLIKLDADQVTSQNILGILCCVLIILIPLIVLLVLAAKRKMDEDDQKSDNRHTQNRQSLNKHHTTHHRKD